MIIITDNKLESTAFTKRDKIKKLQIVEIVMIKNQNDVRISKDFS